MIPRLFFNAIPMFNISVVYNLTRGSSYCADVHFIWPECWCLYEGSDEDRLWLDELLQEFNKRIFGIQREWQVKNLTEFAFVVQPFTMYLVVPDLSYLSNLDCFHPSLLANQKMAIAGWNSIITPASKKKHSFNPDDNVICPTPDTLLYTY